MNWPVRSKTCPARQHNFRSPVLPAAAFLGFIEQLPEDQRFDAKMKLTGANLFHRDNPLVNAFAGAPLKRRRNQCPLLFAINVGRFHLITVSKIKRDAIVIIRKRRLIVIVQGSNLFQKAIVLQ
jgi:hypothetical protein